MNAKTRSLSSFRLQRWFTVFLAIACVLLPLVANAQGLTGALIGTVKDQQGAVVTGAQVRVSSPALIGGPAALVTNETGRLRFPVLPPGTYALDVEMEGFAPYHEENIRIGASATLERTVVLNVAGVAESIVVEGSGSRIEARSDGFETRFGQEYLRTIPTRRYSMFDLIRAAPGMSPTSPSSGSGAASGTNQSVSALGSGGNENLFLIDGTNFTCPCAGVSRAEPGVDMIQEVQIQSVGASAEFGNIQGAVFNVLTRQGSNHFAYDASYYGQWSGLTSQPVQFAVPGSQTLSGYERIKYRDFTTDLGGPVRHDRLWFFTGYQHLRDYDSQPGADPRFPRTYEQDKIFGRLTWKLKPGLQLDQSFHDEFWVNPQVPTQTTPFDTTTRIHAHVPTMTFGHLTHTLSPDTLWDVRVGRFVYSRKDDPSSGNFTTPNRSDQVTKVNSGAPQQIGGLPGTLIRTTVKATLSHYQRGFLGANHEWKVGTQIEQGYHRATTIIPTGVRYVDNNGQPFQSVSADPSVNGGEFNSGALFATDTMTLGERLTVNAGLRFDHNHAISQDLHGVDAMGQDTGTIVRGLGSLFTWNLVSPRLGVTVKLSSDGRTVLRSSYGRFHQGVLTAEISSVHPGNTPMTTRAFDPATGGYTTLVSVVDAKTQVSVDPNTRSPLTDEYSIGVDRELGRSLSVAAAYVGKTGRDYIGWTDVGGQYRADTRTLADGRSVPVFVLVNSPAARHFLVTNPAGYSLKYNGLVLAAEKRMAKRWQAFGSYTFSRATGLQAASGTTPGGAQLSTIAVSANGVFGRDPNDLTNARGRLPNDRPHMLRVMGTVEVPRTGLMIATNFQYYTGKPWAATTQVTLPQGSQRIELEPRGARRLSSQSLLDLRVSRTMVSGGLGRIELLLDVLNVLNITAAEELASDNLFASNFGRPSIFTDPRRAMVGVRFKLGGE
jgi:outer membrane receptor protein involved in Fe transport